MRSLRAQWQLGFLAATLAAFFSGCATAQPTGRKGLLEGASVSDHSHRSNKFAGLERAPAGQQRSSGSGQSAKPAVEIAAGSLRWPLSQISVTSPFGQRGHEFHEGIDLKAPQGTTVLAAQDGMVVYAGSKIRGYGKMVVIRHVRQISTIYAHNSRLLVRSGQYVRQGQKIAITGKTGHVTGPHLHFEVRDGLAALNPMDLLPSSRTASASELSPPTAPIALAAAHKPHYQKIASARPQRLASNRKRRAKVAVAESD